MPAQPDDPVPPQQSPSFLLRVFGGVTTQSLIQTAALGFAFVGAVALLYAVYKIIRSTQVLKPVDPGDLFWQNLIGANIEVIAIVGIAVLSALFALRLFSKAGSLTSQVIREQDRELLEPLISAANKDAINEYIRLASLSGFTGTFQYLGFTGLPLATVALTLILLIVSLWLPDGDLKKGVFDMAKLTLGAFLGSFVQRNVETEKLTRGQGAKNDGGNPSPDERTTIARDIDQLDTRAQDLRRAADAKLAATVDDKKPQVEAVRTALAEIEKSIAAAKAAIADAAQPIDQVKAAATEAKAAAAKIDALTAQLNGI